MARKIIAVLLFAVFLMMAAGCLASFAIPQPQINTIALTPDEDLADAGDPDPFAHCIMDALDAYSPDRDLFNRLYHAVAAHETKADISDFKLSQYMKVHTCDSIYALTSAQFFYLDKISLSKDQKSVKISYRMKPDEIRKNTADYYGLINFIVHDIALTDYSQLQKFFAIYNYIITNSAYTEDMSDPNTFTAFSALVEGRSICNGFSALGNILFQLAGLSCRVELNDAHAWNMVAIGGKNYLTDLTWGAGNGPFNKSLGFALMDDARRQSTLTTAGYGGTKVYVGYPYNEEPVPVCDDPNFNSLGDLPYSLFALDIQGGWIYYCGYGTGIKRMTLDGSVHEDVLSASPAYIAFNNGRLYYVDFKDYLLYSYKPGDAKPVDMGLKPVDAMVLKGGQIVCTFQDHALGEQVLPLIPFNKSDYEGSNTMPFPEGAIPGGRSFSFNIGFSVPMSPEIGEDSLRLVDENGLAMPVSAKWSDDQKTLTIGPQVYWGGKDSLTLYVKDLRSEDGTMLNGIGSMKADVTK